MAITDTGLELNELLNIIHMNSSNPDSLWSDLDKIELSPPHKEICRQIGNEPSLLQKQSVRSQVEQILREELMPVSDAHIRVRKRLQEILKTYPAQPKQPPARRIPRVPKEFSGAWWINLSEEEVMARSAQCIQVLTSLSQENYPITGWRSGLWLLAYGKPYSTWFEAMCKRFKSWDHFLKKWDAWAIQNSVHKTR